MQMNQLFCNLIGNALKFSKAGVSPVINIFSRMLSIEEIKEYADLNQKSSYCEIIFKDEGIGFDQQYAEKIFIIFQRLSQPGLFTGTGIGLAICKKITDQHHGKIFAISKENVVAAFHVILPVKQAR
jgi:Bacteriophytochrome (light-regulated signal transduction histidine kinase)